MKIQAIFKVIAQGLRDYFKEHYEHYFFVADDLLLNPNIDENNYKKYLELTEQRCFIDRLELLHEASKWWSHTKRAINYKYQGLYGVEIENEIPSYEDAEKKLKNYNLEIKPIPLTKVWQAPYSSTKCAEMFK